MAGELTASTPTLVTGLAALKTEIDTLTLTAVTDHLIVVPISESPNQYVVFTVARA